jgi:hypothetical protein
MEQNTPPLALDSTQIRAIELIFQGLRDAEIAKILKIGRTTLWRWKTQSFDFCHCLNDARDQLHVAALDAYQHNLLRATHVLGDCMDDKVKRNRLRAAQIVLQVAGSMRPPMHR